MSVHQPCATVLCSYLKYRAMDVRVIHGHFVKIGSMLTSPFLCNNLIQAYAAAQNKISDARKVFNEMTHRNDFSWFLMISGYTQTSKLKDAMFLFERCKEDAIQGLDDALPNKFIFGVILKWCTQYREIRAGVQFHCSLIKYGIMSDVFISSILINMYSKCERIEQALLVFEQTSSKDVVTWTAMITGLASYGKCEVRDRTFGFFRNMIRQGFFPVSMTFNSIVKIFNEPSNLSHVKQVHGCSTKLGVEDNVLGSALIAAYGRCGGLDEAVKLSTYLQEMDAVCWTSLMAAYMQNGFTMEAILIFRKMVLKGIMIDPFIIAGALSACCDTGNPEMGQEIHGYAVRRCFMDNISVCNAMVTLYGRCHKIRKAETLFFQMEARDDVTWATVLSCYVQNNLEREAVSLFMDMLRGGISPPAFGITAVISACSAMASRSLGEGMHSRVIRVGIDADLSIGNSLITMYGRCGNINAASKLFHSLNRRDAISWNAMITACTHHGLNEEALNMFHMMQQEGIKPDDYSFIGALTSCSHSGLIDEGFRFFKSMTILHGLTPKMEHYACMVDLLGRARRFAEALEFIYTMPCNPDYLVWEALLATCMIHGDLEVGKIANENILQLKPSETSSYNILSNLHASTGMWDSKAQVLIAMKNRGIRKEPSKSWLEIKGVIHDFTVNDMSHPQIDLIVEKLDDLKRKMLKVGYVPDTRFVLQDIENAQKESSLLYHSEKLALAYSLIATDRGTPITIMQNLRCCGDCHTAFKVISSIEDRYIILRDSKRFHHFVNGSCSCKDYW